MKFSFSSERIQSRLGLGLGLLILFVAALLGWGLPLAGLILAPLFNGTWLEIFKELKIGGVVGITTMASIEQSLWSTGISAIGGLVLGLSLGSALSRSRSPLQKSLMSFAQGLLQMPWVVPTLVAATSWTSLLGRHGLGLGYGFWSVVIAHVFYNLPWVGSIVCGVRAQINPLQIAAAQSLGASPWKLFWTLILPQVGPAWGTACLQVFGLCMTSFAIVLLLGGGPPVETLETWIYASVRSQMDSEARSVAAAWASCAIGLTLVAASQGIRRRRTLVEGADLQGGGRGAALFWRQPSGGAILALLCGSGIWMVPYLRVVFEWIFRGVQALGGKLPWETFWPEVLSGSVLDSIWFSASVALVATLWSALWVMVLQRVPQPAKVAGVAGILLNRTGRLTNQWMLLRGARVLWGALTALSGISALVVSLAWVKLIGFPMGNRATFMLGLVQVVLLLPICVRGLWTRVRDRRVMELATARTLGASRLRAWLVVEWPRWRTPLVSGYSVAWAGSLTEVAALHFFAPASFSPLPLELSRMLRQYRFEEAESAAAVLLVASALLMVGVRILSREEL